MIPLLLQLALDAPHLPANVALRRRLNGPPGMNSCFPASS
jgi:hypothetical protein